MMKFPTPRGIATLVTRSVIISECRRLEKRQVIEEEKKKEVDAMAVNTTEAVLVNPAFPDQLEPPDMTGVPRRIKDHNLNVIRSIEPEQQKRRVLAPEKSGVVARDVEEWVKAGIFRPFSLSERLLPSSKHRLQSRLCNGFQVQKFLGCIQGLSSNLDIGGGRGKNGSQIGRNLEACVDDMVVKSNDEKMFLVDVAETFDNLRRINMKLNPKKCSFGVEEVASYAEGNAELGREASSPKQVFSKVSRKIKKCIMDLPSLTLSFPKETLYVYLAVSKEAVSSVLLTERKGKQRPIQYVITDQPIKQILNKTKASRKLAKYAIELGTYNITFAPRNDVKGQILVDLISETPDGESPENYFCSPKQVPKRDATKDTNNEAEYEELLAGLRIEKEMGIQKLAVKVDSKLVASQINENYVANSDNIMKYLAKAKEYIAGFGSFSINKSRGTKTKRQMSSANSHRWLSIT
ncbi:reverse transcriptase domain-containing protein [Tanacetum coccineum]